MITLVLREGKNEVSFEDEINIFLSTAGKRGGLAQWLASRTTYQGVPGSRPGRVVVSCGLEQVTFTPCIVLV